MFPQDFFRRGEVRSGNHACTIPMHRVPRVASGEGWAMRAWALSGVYNVMLRATT
jgi:hypothetical protein